MQHLASALLLFLVVSRLDARNVPSYDLDDDFYTEIRNLVAEQLSLKNQVAFHPREVIGWGPQVALGQVTGVSVDPEGNPVVLHRADRTFGPRTFNGTNHLWEATPIPEDVVLTLSAHSGHVIDSWGQGLFYLPHGLTVDLRNNVWVTDVGAHQVMKFVRGSSKCSLVVGETLQPGSDLQHFCKPTAVAVARTGDFYVADGYCNSRIVHFDAQGTPLGTFQGSEGERPTLQVPHALALREDDDALCVADRDNGRVACVRAGRQRPNEFGQPIGDVNLNGLRVFGVDTCGRYIVAVGGSEVEDMATGVTIDSARWTVVDTWNPLQQLFQNPHSLAVDHQQNVFYVTEIGPNKIWKFTLQYHNATL